MGRVSISDHFLWHIGNEGGPCHDRGRFSSQEKEKAMKTKLLRSLTLLALLAAFLFTATFAVPQAEAAKAKKAYRIAVVVPNGVDPLLLLEVVRQRS